jgi:predicted ATPase
MAGRRKDPRLPAPWLRSIRLDAPIPDRAEYPFTLPWLDDDFEMAFEQPVTILTGENGSGKSTLVEAIAALAGFPTTGGGAWSGDAALSSAESGPALLARQLRPGWLPKVGQGWFLRAASFSAVAEMTASDYLSVSHGEGFAELMMDRMGGRGLFLLDEPEAALSPRRQAELLAFLSAIQREADAQVIMATHSPILMAVPGATLLRLSHRGIAPVMLRDTSHFRLYQSFALDPEAFVEAAIAGDLDALA